MALIKCKECGKEISDKAKKCPNCGYVVPPKKLTKLDKIFIPIISIVIFGGIFGIIYSPELVKYSYPHFQTYKENVKDALIGYDYDGNEIRGNSYRTHYDWGEMETDYSQTILAVIFSIGIPIATIITYIILKKKENKKDILIANANQ